MTAVTAAVGGAESSNMSPHRRARYSCQGDIYPRFAAADRVGNPQKGGDSFQVAGVLDAYNGADKGIPKGGAVGGSTCTCRRQDIAWGTGMLRASWAPSRAQFVVWGNHHLGLGGGGPPVPALLVDGCWYHCRTPLHPITQGRYQE